MKSLSEVMINANIQRKPFVNVHANPVNPQQHKTSAVIDKQSIEVVNRLFLELSTIFPAWRHAFPSDQLIDLAKINWSKALIEAGITNIQQLDLAMRKARASSSPFMPSVGEFISWCKPTAEDLGLPDFRDAYFEACANIHQEAPKWSHAAVFVATKATGYFNLKTLPESVTAPIFKRNYEITIRRIINGENFDHEIPKALPKQKTPIPTSQEQALKNLATIRKKLGLRA